MEALLNFFALTTADGMMVPVGALLFVLLWLALSRFVFTPFLALVEERERVTTGAADGLRAERETLAKLSEDYDARLAAARVEAMRAKLTRTEGAKAEAQKIVTHAEQEAQVALKNGRQTIQTELDTLRRDSAGEVERLARLLIDRITSSQIGKGPAMRTAILFLVSLLAAAPAWCEAAAEHGHHPSIIDLKWYVVNFVLFCAVIWYFVKDGAIAGWHERRRRIAAEVDQHRRDEETLQRDLRAIEARIRALPQEIEALSRTTAADAQREAEQLVADAHKRAQRITAQAAATLDNERRAAQTAVQREVGDRAVTLAGSKLQAELNLESDRPIRERTLSGVRGLVELH